MNTIHMIMLLLNRSTNPKCYSVLNKESILTRELTNLIGEWPTCILEVIPSPQHYGQIHNKECKGAIGGSEYQKKHVLNAKTPVRHHTPPPKRKMRNCTIPFKGGNRI